MESLNEIIDKFEAVYDILGEVVISTELDLGEVVISTELDLCISRTFRLISSLVSSGIYLMFQIHCSRVQE